MNYLEGTAHSERFQDFGDVAAHCQTRQRLWVVDDDYMLCDSLRQAFVDAGFAVDIFSNGSGLLKAFDTCDRPNLILLDWHLPDMLGSQILEHLIRRASTVPVLLLTGRVGELYEAEALAAGAADFVNKTRSFRILLKRVENILSGATEWPTPDLKHDGGSELKLDRLSHRAYWKGNEVQLSLREFTLIDFLSRNAGQDFSYRQVYDVIRGVGFIVGDGPDGCRQSVRATIKRIRAKFCSCDPSFDGIENYPSFGYRWKQTKPLARYA